MTRQLADWIRQSPLFAYLFLVFGIEWLLVFLLSSLVPPILALLIGSWLPNIVGVVVTGITVKQAGLRELFGRVVRWHIGFRWYAMAVGLPIATALIAIGLWVARGNGVPEFALSLWQVLPILTLALITGATGEELGWRGTALPLLQARRSPLVSSLILGGVWGLYHLPSFLLSGLPLQDMPLIPFMAAAISLNILMVWGFNHTGGSLVAPVLFHLTINFMGNAMGIFANPALFSVLSAVWAAAASAVIILDWAHFTRPGLAPIGGAWATHTR